MWRLRVGKGKEQHLLSINNFHGRRYWEFDEDDAGTQEERAQVEKARYDYTINRFHGVKFSSNLLMRMQLRKENGVEMELKTTTEAHEDPLEEDEEEEEITIRLKKGIQYFSTLQLPDGHWPSDLPGPLFIGPLVIIALYITQDLNNVFSPEHKRELKRYIYNHQKEDGGWGIHAEGDSTMFGSVLNYVALRILEVDPNGEDEISMAAAQGHKWILDHGGAVAIPSWGKFWLAFLGVYDWEGCNPIAPEIWLLPTFLPLNPGKFHSFCRLTYMPMSYLFGKRFVGPITELVQVLRQELYNEPYNKIDWSKASKTCAKEDEFHEVSWAVKWGWGFLRKIDPILMRWPASVLRKKALKVVSNHIHYEDINSRYKCIGSVEKVLSLLACWAEDPNSEEYKYHLPRLHDYLWLAEDGMTMLGTLSQLWDVCFSIQAIISSGFAREYWPTLTRAYDYVKESQIHENPSGNYTEMYRHATKGAWTFENLEQGWPVSDCTAEGLKAALMLSQVLGQEFNKEYAYDAVNLLISYQSKTGGFPAWEPARASHFIEMFNPIEFFEDALIEREYTECTSSVVQALVLFSEIHPEYLKNDVQECIKKGVIYIENNQCPDGSWYGRWGVCFTYGTWFGVEALVSCGRSLNNSTCLEKACSFLLSKQLPCGGWGESYLSCHNKVYTNLEGDRAHVVHTAWAVLSLMKAGQAEKDPTPIHRGMKVLTDFQLEDGDFPQQEATGIFMRYCTLSYSSFRNIFALWALAEYRRLLIEQETN